MPNKSVHLTRGAGAPLAGKLRRYAGTLKARSALGSFALRARFPKTLRGKATVNPRNFGQPWIPAGERSGLWTRIATRESVSLCTRTRTGAAIASFLSPLIEIARVLVRFNHVASFIVNPNYRANGSETLPC